VLTIVSGLLSALSYATSDLLSQRVTRRARALVQVAWVLVIGVVASVPLALLVEGLPSGTAEWRAAGLSALAGVGYFGGFFTLLRALRVGDLGLVAALNSLMGAYAAVAFVLLGAPVTPMLVFALVLCVFGAVLTSVEGRAKTTKGAGWAFVSGALFATVLILYGNAGDLGWISQAAISRTVSFAIAMPAALLTGGIGLPRDLRLTAAGAGVLELSGLFLLTAALALGPVTVASVTTTQFGTFAVVLGFALLHERPRRHQWVGIAATIAGVSLLAVIA
jgi:drug/metabolite transporter (DMT)-like permease